MRTVKRSDEKFAEQDVLLNKIVAIKGEVGARGESTRLINMLDTTTESLMMLTISITNVSREKLVKREEEVAAANSFIVKGGIGASQLSIGKELLAKIVGIGKFKETNFREWRHTLMVSLHCMDKEIYDEITKFERTGKEEKSVWIYPAPSEGEEEPHLPEHIDKKLQLILVNSISDKETKSLPSFMENHTYPVSEAWKYFMKQTHTSRYHAERVTRENFWTANGDQEPYRVL